jgi:hypothetical protein
MHASAGWSSPKRPRTLRSMDPRAVIAQRIDLQLRRHLGEGVDAPRTLSDERYARDVLLVCDAMAGTDLPVLARQFRVAGKLGQKPQRGGHDAGPPQPWAADTSGFGHSRPLELGQRSTRQRTTASQSAAKPEATAQRQGALSVFGRWFNH